MVAEKLALVDPVGMVRLEGTVNAGLLLVRIMLTVPLAGLFRDTMQTALALLPRAVGEQVTDESCAGALALNVKAWEAPFKAAVKIAV